MWPNLEKDQGKLNRILVNTLINSYETTYSTHTTDILLLLYQIILSLVIKDIDHWVGSLPASMLDDDVLEVNRC